MLSTMALTAISFFDGCSKGGSGTTPTPVLTITTLSVNTGPYNTSVIITGTAFSPTAANDQVFFNGKAATIISATSTQISTTVPVGAGTGNVTVSVNNGTPATGPVFTYQPTLMVSTFAGTGISGSADGTSTVASFSTPSGIAIDKSGNIFVADFVNGRIRKITPQGVVSTFAGSAISGFSDGTGAAASFAGPEGLTIDNNDNLYVAEDANRAVRKITPAGVVTTIAGNGTQGYLDGAGKNAMFGSPAGIACDASGNLFVCDPNNHVVREINNSGVVSTYQKGNVTFYSPNSVAVDKSGNVYVTDGATNETTKITPAGIISLLNGSTNSTTHTLFYSSPSAITTDANNNVYVANGFVITKITPDNVATTYAGTTLGGSYTGAGNAVWFSIPAGLAFDAAGNLFVANTGAHRISEITSL